MSTQSGATSRSRTLPFGQLTGITHTGTRVGPYPRYGKQTTLSLNNGGPPYPGIRYDHGGDFFTTKHIYTERPVKIVATAGGGPGTVMKSYEGQISAWFSDVRPSDFPVTPFSNDAQLDAFGTTAISRCIPTNPSGSLVTTLGELRAEGLPKLIGAQTRQREALDLRGASGEYLNIEFGIKPFLSELRSFAKNVKDSNEHLTKYRKGADKLLHRQFVFDTETNVEETSMGTRYPTPALETTLMGPTAAPLAQGPVNRTVIKTVRRWFSGAFRYHVPVGNDMVSRFARYQMEADALYGVALTPEVIYNLTPWSWAFDWVGNMGDVVTNVSAFLTDGLVMQYGYVMEETHYDAYYTWDYSGGSYSEATGVGTTGRKAGQVPPTLVQRLETITKVRRRATPYGFGLSWDGFSPRQLAILGAIGITRSAPTHQ